MLSKQSQRALITCFLLLIATPLSAFYQAQSENVSTRLNGAIFVAGSFLNNPNDNLLFEKDKVEGLAVSSRLIAAFQFQSLTTELHVVQHFNNQDFRSRGSVISHSTELNRSGFFDWELNGENSHGQIDRLNVSLNTQEWHLKIGRQVINLARTFYFTPNDFFAPFLAQNFFRTYKSGVDAMRLIWQPNLDAELELISVLNYDLDKSYQRKNSPNWSKTEHLARLSILTEQFEYGLLAAKLVSSYRLGFDIQGQIYGGIGVRGEGHFQFQKQRSDAERDFRFALALDKTWEQLTLRLEYYHRHLGLESLTNSAQRADLVVRDYYRAKSYSALAVGYRSNALWNSELLLISNLQDNSQLWGLYVNYSLSDEAELAISLNIPNGKKPRLGGLKSELGALPHSLNLEYRVYF